jgi:hypothetical protein
VGALRRDRTRRTASARANAVLRVRGEGLN